MKNLFYCLIILVYIIFCCNSCSKNEVFVREKETFIKSNENEVFVREKETFVKSNENKVSVREDKTPVKSNENKVSARENKTPVKIWDFNKILKVLGILLVPIVIFGGLYNCVCYFLELDRELHID
ncbi:MAG: hypothetical protein LBN01_02680 [Endomicrobium sp.]|jgi:hypothetical protein|nr:hypothetical protein [Endomicrobium sp.]